jgi:F5/8 type C domain
MMREGSPASRLLLFRVCLAYLLLAVAFTYPLVIRWRAAVPHDVGDPVLNAWILWWNSVNVPLTSHWWQAPAFFPATDVLTFSEHLLGLAIISAPVQWITHNPALAYNVVFLLSYALSGIAGYLLVLEITGRTDAAWVAGVLFALAPYRADQVSHVQVLSAYWMPLALAALHAYVRTDRPRWLVAFAFCLTLQGLANGYFLMFFPVLVGLWILWFTPLDRFWKSLAGMVAALVSAGLVWLPFLLHYQAAHDHYGFVRSLEEITGFSADLASVFTASDRVKLWAGLQTYAKPEGSLFPGLVTPLILLAALAWWRPWAKPRPARGPRLIALARGMVAAVMVAWAAALVSFWWLGPWRVSIAGIAVSVSRADTLAPRVLIACALLAVTSPRVMAARLERAPLGFYVVAAIVMWVFALGPSLEWRGAVLPYASMPYGWLMHLPGFDGLRVPARFWMLAVLCLSAAAGCAYARVVRPEWKGSWALAAVITCAAFAEGWMGPMPMIDVPPRSPLLERVVRYPVLELPIDSGDFDRAAMYRGIFHGEPVGNGTSGYTAPHYAALAFAIDHQDPAILTKLAAVGLRDLAVDRRRDPGGKYASFIAAYPGVQVAGEDAGEIVYRLPAVTADPGLIGHGPRLAIANVATNVNPQYLPRLLDDDPRTRWESGPQRPGQELVVTLDAERPLGAIELDLGPSFADFPRGLEISVSSDNDHWTVVRSGSTAIEAFTGALADPGRLPLVFDLKGVHARYVRLVQTGFDPTFYWSDTALDVYGIK